MTVFIDDAYIEKNGRFYCHLMSDELSDDELHNFAIKMGLPHHRFHRDHYDVTADLRETAVSLGAIPCKPSDLVKIRRKKRRYYQTS
ncbi:MAG: DUF4031 domain-containing protein [Chloroflexota bacterium]